MLSVTLAFAIVWMMVALASLAAGITWAAGAAFAMVLLNVLIATLAANRRQ